MATNNYPQGPPLLLPGPPPPPMMMDDQQQQQQNFFPQQFQQQQVQEEPPPNIMMMPMDGANSLDMNNQPDGQISAEIENSGQNNFYSQQEQEQHQSQRINGDGQEVYGFNNYLVNPAPLPIPMPPQLPTPPIMPPAALPNPGVGQGTTTGGGSGSYDPPPFQNNVNNGTSNNNNNNSNPPPVQPSPSVSSYEHRPYHRRGRDRGRDRDSDDDDYDRPPSRSSYHPDEYYSREQRRRGRRREPERDLYREQYKHNRGPPSEYDYRTYPSRHARQPYSYMDYPPVNTSFGGGIPPFGQNPYMTPYGVVPPIQPQPQTQNLQEYLVILRTQNPALYRDWYNKFLVHSKDPSRIPFPSVPGFFGVIGGGKTPQPGSLTANSSFADKSSRSQPQSGPSSVIDGQIGNTTAGHDSNFLPIQQTQNREPSPPARMTPLMFSTPHAIAKISSLGWVIRNRYGSPNIEMVSIRQFMKRLPEYKDVKAFPGPLIKDITHKNTIVQFCQRKIRELELYDAQMDHENIILLWELLILLLRQNGSAIGSDIAELLLKSKSTGGKSLNSPTTGSERESSEDEREVIKENRKGKAVNPSSSQRFTSSESDQKYVDVFCQKLIFGQKREALEYAMDNALWGHALFFASKMDEKLYGTVLARFANSTMSLSNPLQTLYHVLCGKQPPSVTCCGDESFGDWKPHLAMLLSNMGQRPEFEAKTMRTLGRTLANKNLKFAAQFCFLMAESEFSEDSDIGPLLGFDPSNNNILEATQMTEIYEFARSLANPDFTLGVSFIESKFNYTKQLINLGFIQEAYGYCEEITKSLRKISLHEREKTIASNILCIAERLINCDLQRSSGEPEWIDELRKMADQLESETTSRKLSLATSTSDHIDDVSSVQQSQTYIPNEINEQHQNDVYISNNTENQTVPITPAESNSNAQYPSNVQPFSQWNNNQQNAYTDYGYNPSSSTVPSFTPQFIPPEKSEINNYQPQREPNNYAPMFTPDLGGINGNNNNYLPPQQLSDNYNSLGSVDSMTKKKVVRFQDEETNGDMGYTNRSRNLDNLQSKVVHEKSSKMPDSKFSYKSNSHENVQVDRSAVRELIRLNSPPVTGPLNFQSTFPIDEPISKSIHFEKMPSNITFPTDITCCDPSDPCDEHKDELDYDSESDYGDRDTNYDYLQNMDYTDNIYGQQQPPLQNHHNNHIPSSRQLPQANSAGKSEKRPKENSKGGQKKEPGWLSGMFSALSFKPKNQMILPEDKDPTIVWDEATKSWKNTKDDDDESSAPKGPPPKDSDLMRMSGPPSMPQSVQNVPMDPQNTQPNHHQQMPHSLPNHVNLPTINPPASFNPQLQNNSNFNQPNASFNPPTMQQNGGGVNNNSASSGPGSLPPPSGPNKFQRPKGLQLRNNYVDVFGSNNNSSTQPMTDVPKMPLSVAAPMAGSGGMPNIFMPPPMSAESGPTSFLSSADTNGPIEDGYEPQTAAPPMYNPAQFPNQNIQSYGVNQ